MRESFELIILTKSAKHGGYCVAGINPHNGKWYRLVTNDKDKHGALSLGDMKTAKGEVIIPLDHVFVTDAENVGGKIQTENYLIQDQPSLRYIRHESLKNVLRIHPSENAETVFYGDHHCMYGCIDEIGHSLELHCVKDLKITAVQVSDKIKTKADFVLNGKRLENYAVTDPNFFLKAGEVVKIPEACLVFSIADDEWCRQNGYYKYIAAIYDLAEHEAVPNRQEVQLPAEYLGEESVKLLSDDAWQYIHPTYGKGRIESIDKDGIIVRFANFARRLSIKANDFINSRRSSSSIDTLLSVKQQLFENPMHLTPERIREVKKQAQLATTSYLSLLDKNGTGRSITHGRIESINRNILTIQPERKLKNLDMVVFEYQGIEYDQELLEVDEYDESTGRITVRALGECSKFEWDIGQTIDIVSDMKFLIKSLNQWYNTYGDEIAYPPMPGLRGNIQYKDQKISEEQKNAIVRSLNAPVSYVWGAPGTGKTSYVLANSIRYCMERGLKVGLFAPTNHSLDMALTQVIDCLTTYGLDYRTTVHRIGVPSQFLIEKYPEVCEHTDQTCIEKKYQKLCEQIQKVLNSRSALKNIKSLKGQFSLIENTIQLRKQFGPYQVRYSELRRENEELNRKIGLLTDEETKLWQQRGQLETELKIGLGGLLQRITGEKQRIQSSMEECRNRAQYIERQIQDFEADLKRSKQEEEQLSEMLKEDHTAEYLEKVKRECALNEYTRMFFNNLTADSIAAKYASLCQTVESGEKAALATIEEYAQYQPISDTELVHLLEEYSAKATATVKQKKNIQLLASTLDLYNMRVGVVGKNTEKENLIRMSFDQIFLDEAGYCSIPKALPLFAQGCPVTFLGDHMQLQPISEMRSSDKATNPEVTLWDHSAIQICDLFNGSLGNTAIPKSRELVQSNLTYSHRFSNELASVLDRGVYRIGFTGLGDKTISITSIDAGPSLKDDEKNSSSSEANAVVSLSKQLQGGDFAILTPYRNQVALIGRKNRELFEEEKLMTIHRSQGREWDTVILSIVDEGPGYFTNSRNEVGVHVINTALSRAKKQLILIGNLQKWKDCKGQLITELLLLKDTKQIIGPSHSDFPEVLSWTSSERVCSSGTTMVDGSIKGIKQEKKGKEEKPARAGESWSKEEDQLLESLFSGGIEVQEIARRLQRTNGAITARLKRNGLMM